MPTDASHPCFYGLPLSRAFGGEWELNFSNALYYLAIEQDTPIRTTTRAIAILMAGNIPTEGRYTTIRHHFMNQWRAAVERDWLKEETPPHHLALKADTDTLRPSYRGKHRIYYFTLTSPQHTEPFIYKPCGYISNGWIGMLKGVYPTSHLKNGFLIYFSMTN